MLRWPILGLVAMGERDAFFERPTEQGLDDVESLNLTADVLMVSGVAVLVGMLAWELLSGPPLASAGSVTVDR